MRNIYKYMSNIMYATTLVLCITSCSPDNIDRPEESGIPQISDFEDYINIEINQETNWVTFSFNAKEAIPVWIIDGKQYSTAHTFTKYYRKAGDYSIEVKVSNFNGVSDKSIKKTFHIDNTIINGFGGFDYNSEFNMWKSATIESPVFWYAPNWQQVADPKFEKTETGYVISLSEATKEQWQAQMKLNTNITTSSSSNYDFSVILTSTKNHPRVTVKLTNVADENSAFFNERIKLKENESVCFWKSNMSGIDINNIQLVFDFGGNEAGTDIEIDNIVIKNHANDDGTKLP